MGVRCVPVVGHATWGIWVSVCPLGYMGVSCSGVSLHVIGYAWC